MKTVMIQRGTALGNSLPGDGDYLKFFDFEAYDGVGYIETTPDLASAMKFDDFASACAFWKTQPKCRPYRPDGQPNRPLTAANWEFAQVPE